MKEKKQELAEKLQRKSSRTHKHRIRELEVQDAEEEIKEYASQPLQDTIRGDNL